MKFKVCYNFCLPSRRSPHGNFINPIFLHISSVSVLAIWFSFMSSRQLLSSYLCLREVRTSTDLKLQYSLLDLNVYKCVSSMPFIFSAYTLIVLALDRYFAILYPLQPRLRRSQALGVICGVWVSTSKHKPTGCLKDK